MMTEKPFGREDASKFYDWLGHSYNEWTEIRVIHPRTKKVEDDVFVSSKDAFLKKCEEWNGIHHVYAGVNPRKIPNGKAEAVSRVVAIPFDVDPPKVRRDQSATENEKKVAYDRLREIVQYVKERGFGTPYIDDSGNGYRLCLKVNLQVSNREEMEARLRAFFLEFKEEFPFLENISDLPRLIKVPGTWALKGEDTPQRPHRQSKLIQLGDLVPNDNLQSYIQGLTPEPEASPRAKSTPTELELDTKKLRKLRPCFRRFLEVGGRFTPRGDRDSETRMRQQFVKEMMAAGFSKSEILGACTKFEDYEKEKTEYEVGRIYDEIEQTGLTHWTCKSIHKHGGCLGPKCKLYAKNVEGTKTGTPIGNYWLRKRGNKVFLFNKDDEPIFSCSVNCIDGPRIKKRLLEKTGLSADEIDKATASFQFALQSIRKSQSNVEENEEAKEEKFDEETIEKAWELLRDPAFFYKLGWVFEDGFIVSKLNKPRFIIGEERNKRLLGPLLVGASKLGMTSITKVLGDPATAKDSMLRMWLDLLPIKSVERSYFTAASLRYSQEMKDADLLYIPDSPELRGEMGRHLRFMRADDGGLISEYATRDAETGEMVTKTSRLPVKAVATTSNAITSDRALESGMWTMRTNGSKDLTKKVKEEKLKLWAGQRPLFPEDELKVWRCAFKLLILEDLPDALPQVPFAEQLATLLESERSESRRDPDKLCDLISLIAWMRRFQRNSDARGEADLTDLFLALQIGLDAMTETISELNEKENKIFQSVKNGALVTCRYVADETKIPYKTCFRYLEKLVEKGFLNKEKEKGKNFYSVLQETPKQLLISQGRSFNQPDELIKLVLKSFRNFSTSHEGMRVSFIDPLSGSEVKINVKNGEPEVTVENKTYSYPYEKLRTSERSEETISETEKKPKKLLPSPMRRDFQPIDELERNLCSGCGRELGQTRVIAKEEFWLCDKCAEAIEYALEMMVKRLPNKTTEDNFRHDLKFKGLTDEEARKVLNQLEDEGVVRIDKDGWLVKRKRGESE